MSELSNKEAASIVASVTLLASVLQFIHGKEAPEGERQTYAPAVQALIRSSEEVLSSRGNPTHKAYAKNMAKEFLPTYMSFVKRTGMTYLEQVIALVEYLEYLRTSKIGMDTDEMYLSLTVYNIAQAYSALLVAKQADVRRDKVIDFQHELLRRLR